MTPKSGRAIAWLSFLLGIGVSIAGNIGHAASDGMKPGEWAGAAFWPLALMLTIEILTRVRWQPEKRWIIARIAGLLAVAVVAAVLSYRHLAGLMTYWGEDWVNAHLGPLAVDGLMLVAATALLSISKERAAPTTAELTDRRHVFTWPKPIGPKQLGKPLPLLTDLVDAEKTEAAAEKVRQSPGGGWVKPALHTVQSISSDDADDAAFQAFISSNGTLKPKDLQQFGMSRSTAYRRHGEWNRRIQR